METTSMSTVVLLLIFVAAAYLLTRFVIDALERRFAFSTGLEFVVLGVLLGPAVPQIAAFDNLSALAPIIALAAGWIGLVYGMELNLGHLAQTRDQALRMGLADAAGTGAAVLFASEWALSTGILGQFDPSEVWLASGLMAVTAAAGSSSAIELQQKRHGDRPLLDLLGRMARFGDLFAIFGFGILFCYFHQGATATSTPPNASDWFLITVGIGLALGILFTAFLDRNDGDNERFVALVGIITFAAGASFFLNVSVLLVNVVLGVVLANTNRAEGAIKETLAGTSGPISLVLLVFAGALWQPVSIGPALIATGGLVAVRALGKAGSCWIGSMGTGLRADLSRGMLAQGDVTVAMALSFRLVYDGPAVDLAYTAVLGSVVISEFVAPRILEGLLIDAGEVRAEVHAASGG